jgi:myosin protein heavy chain
MTDLQAKLSTTEQASAKATLNVSLLTAQHKRELADVQRELDRLQSNGNPERVIAELEERNKDMEQLLQQKCAEIEENDDRALEYVHRAFAVVQRQSNPVLLECSKRTRSLRQKLSR